MWRGSRTLAAARLLVYLTWTGLLLPFQIVAVGFDLRLAKTLPRFYHRVCCRILGLDVEVRGALSDRRPLLLVCNHSSYVDITVLASLVAGSFVAKREVADWPFFGLLAKLQQTVFIDRQGRNVGRQRDAMQARLERGDDLILFPEGTSNDGNRVLPFKSALFSVAERTVEGRPIDVQPVSIAYTRLNGIPLGRALRPFFAWYGDMSLAPHLVSLLGFGRVRVVVEFHPVVTIDAFGSRRAMAAGCRQIVAEGVARALSDRPAQYA